MARPPEGSSDHSMRHGSAASEASAARTPLRIESLLLLLNLRSSSICSEPPDAMLPGISLGPLV